MKKILYIFISLLFISCSEDIKNPLHGTWYYLNEFNELKYIKFIEDEIIIHQLIRPDATDRGVYFITKNNFIEIHFTNNRWCGCSFLIKNNSLLLRFEKNSCGGQTYILYK